ncbi:MaoC/PaaZ C-terminal domain-containing protein [Maritimibacter sp. UBA3975]|uniref:MaoC/PaaZ C-terminal domain-containing protein n=1 Tax=Maritimibacter sp. UBA3975 TaxID=1946833 RepID=UPI000C0A9449|nr:MaoC/PaaZ C-terminal domain-containing protein [Maritimibacter sp. UBA3975]MAM63045.1 enoyl-CoA hydratase [Maritimibacter sp.]|tara:strand:+ start:24201 stop:24653 length:453 start_codon:yes stop_codon:yes gene_type:complete
MTPIYFEDLSVGGLWHSGEIEMDEAKMIAYAQEFDPQSMHIDPVAAAEGPHGTIIASGMMIMALTLKLFIEAGGYGGNPTMGLGTDEVRWSAVVRPGDRLTAHRETTALRRSRSNPRKGLVTTRIWMTNQKDETVFSMVSTAMIAARTDG